MERKIRFVLNFRVRKTFFLLDEFRRLGIPVEVFDYVHPWFDNLDSFRNPFRYWVEIFRTAWRGLGSAKRGQIVVAWCFDLGVAIKLLSLLTFRDFGVVANNLIFDTGRKTTIRRWIKRVFLKFIMSRKGFVATVNSDNLVEEYSRYFGVSSDRFAIVHDSYDDGFPVLPWEPGDGSVFCGGMNYRDWATFVACAKARPQVRFVGVADRKRFLLEDRGLPENLEMRYNIPESEFYDLMSSASVVCLPLDTDAPAGLIVMVRAGLANRPVVTSRTGPTEVFGDYGRTALLVPRGDVMQMVEALDGLLVAPEKRLEMADAMSSHLVSFDASHCARAIVASWTKLIGYERPRSQLIFDGAKEA